MRNLLLLYLLLFSGISFAQLKLPAIFTDNMVLQRDKNIPVWGTTEKNKIIIVQLGKKTFSTKSNTQGKWKLELTPFKAGGPYEMKIISGDTIIFKNVMIGEVWICSGQSNMAMGMDEIGSSYGNQKEIAEANYPDIRLFTVEPITAATPQVDLKGTGWMICDSNTVKRFSAVGFFFGKNIYKELNIPIGLINTSYGGTDIEAWTSSQSLAKISFFDSILESIKKYAANDSSFLKEYNSKRDEWKSTSMNTDPGMPASGETWKDYDFNCSNWKTMNVPALWVQDELQEFNGSVWYRKEINISEELIGKDFLLNMGPIDDIDVTWFNGTLLGSNELWDKPRQYVIPAKLVKPGKNVLVVRCIDTGGPGGMWGEANQYNICSSTDTISIAGEWYYKQTLAINEFPPRPTSFDNPNCPTVLFNAMVAPIIPFAMRGVIWYQGENNTYHALQYRTLFPLMINDWRSKWSLSTLSKRARNNEFPFYFVQLANYMNGNPEPVDDTWAELREAQLMTLKVKNTGMASAIDIGDSSNIHPKNKRELGRRLALIALNKTYGKKIDFSGPVYKSYKIYKNNVTLNFDYAVGLNCHGDALKGFSIAGSDGKFIWADAKIIGSSVVVWNNKISNPVSVRYGWSSNPVCNLINGTGLPASPFRTDDWKVLTEDFKESERR